jgi:hypothetical protein
VVTADGRLTDWVSLGVLASSVPRDAVDDAVEAAGRRAKRSDGKLPPHVMVYFLLDRLSSISGLALQFGRHEWLDRSLKALVAIYKLGFDANGYAGSSPAVVELWIDLVAHVYGLGGLAIRLEDWEAAR